MPTTPDVNVTLAQKKRTRILLAEDDPCMLAKISKLLQADFEVVGAVSDGQSLVEAAAVYRPEIIVSDITMPKLNGFAAARKIRDSLPEIKFIFLTMHSDRWYQAAAFDIGASAYILKSSAREDLSRAVQDAGKDCP